MTESVDGGTGGALTPPERSLLLAFHYLAADEAGQYVTIMRILADDVGGLLSDWSAPELAATLADRAGLVLDVDTVEARLRYLLDRGNLTRSPRESEARSIQEYMQVRARYQVTPVGERVHRLVAEILGDPGGAQEISTELLPPRSPRQLRSSSASASARSTYARSTRRPLLSRMTSTLTHDCQGIA